MVAAYLAVTLLAAAVYGLAAVANVIGHVYPEARVDRLRLPWSWLLPWGTLLAAGALGLLVGLVVLVVGTLAAGPLVLYFLGAFGAHLRVRDHQVGSWVTFVALAVAALAVNVVYRHG